MPEHLTDKNMTRVACAMVLGLDLPADLTALLVSPVASEVRALAKPLRRLDGDGPSATAIASVINEIASLLRIWLAKKEPELLPSITFSTTEPRP